MAELGEATLAKLSTAKRQWWSIVLSDVRVCARWFLAFLVATEAAERYQLHRRETVFSVLQPFLIQLTPHKLMLRDLNILTLT